MVSFYSRTPDDRSGYATSIQAGDPKPAIVGYLRAIGRPKLVEITVAVSRAAETSLEEICKTRGHPLRALIAWLGWHEGLHTLRSIAATLRL